MSSVEYQPQPPGLPEIHIRPPWDIVDHEESVNCPCIPELALNRDGVSPVIAVRVGVAHYVFLHSAVSEPDEAWGLT